MRKNFSPIYKVTQTTGCVQLEPRWFVLIILISLIGLGLIGGLLGNGLPAQPSASSSSNLPIPISANQRQSPVTAVNTATSAGAQNNFSQTIDLISSHSHMMDVNFKFARWF